MLPEPFPNHLIRKETPMESFLSELSPTQTETTPGPALALTRLHTHEAGSTLPRTVSKPLPRTSTRYGKLTCTSTGA